MAAGQLAQNILGSQRALVDRVTLVNAIKFPFMAMVPKGPTVDNLKYEWPVDKFEDPEDQAVVDGTDVNEFSNAAEDYGVLSNRIQWLRDSAMVSKLSQDVQNQAGIKNKKAYAIKKKLEKLWRDIETAFCSDNEMQVGTGSVGNKLRGLGVWVQSTAQSVEAVPTDFLTGSAAIHTGTIAQLTEDVFQGLLTGIWANTGQISRYTLLCGSTLRSAFTAYTKTSSGSTNTQAAIRTYDTKLAGKKITATIDVYEGDFGTVEIIPSHWLAYFTSAAANLRRGYIIDWNMLDCVWKQMPKVEPLPDLGGGPRFLVDAIVGLRCYNPQGLGKISSTS